ncbi:MAG: helix-turn-helix transcriptional regulator [Desulfobacterales bacterium]|nr:helix-turn-helix transcriptional regulator [Desulfobacterales bacterium]
MLTEEDIRLVSTVLSALGNPTRLRIVELVSKTERPLHIKAVAEILEKDYAAVYRHIKVLQEAGLLKIYEVGRSRVLHPKEAGLIEKFVKLAKKTMKKEWYYLQKTNIILRKK